MPNSALRLLGSSPRIDARRKPLLYGEYLNDYHVDASHATRMAARLSSAGRFEDCVGWGYIVDYDEATRDRGYADIEVFLKEHWSEL